MMKNIFALLLVAAPALMVAAEELYPCEPDATGRFYVPGTAGGEMRYCDWAARADTEERCKIEQVAWQCPVTCQVPCIDTSGDALVFGAAAVDPTSTGGGSNNWGYIAGGVLAGLALVIVGAAVLSNKKNSKEVEPAISIDEDENLDELYNPYEQSRVESKTSVNTGNLQGKGSFIDSCCAPC